MSNVVVGDIYKQVIEKIIQAAKTDFEEGGYAPETLTDLKNAWQENLSKLKVAQMPWDPKPQPPKAPVKTEAQDNTPRNGEASRNAQTKQEIKYEIDTKPEIKYEGHSPTYNGTTNNSYAGSGINPMAQQRAAHLLTQQYGSQASASIQASGLPQQQQQQQPRSVGAPGQQRPHSIPPVQRPTQSAYPNQTDGPSDGSSQAWDNITMSSRVTESERVATDGMIRRYVEDGFVTHELGLGTTQKEREAMYKRADKDKQIKSSLSENKKRKIAQMDGVDDEEDEDAINSALDDSEDEHQEQSDDEDGPLGEMILCTWDKVNRVKNKWKCTLKDGVLATGGKEYLFHKATGEFEW